MKNSFLSLFCILLTFTSAKARTEFAPIGAEWYYSWDNDLYPTKLHYAHYRSEKDTLFKGKQCRQILVEHVSYNGDSSSYRLFSHISGDTVFHFNWEFNKFTPLFIFNVKAGDTLQFYIPKYTIFTEEPPDISGDSIIYVIVERVDTLMVDSIPLRRVWLNRYIDGYAKVAVFSPYIERIGSLFNFMPYYKTFLYFPDIPDYSEGSFRCYTDSLINYHTMLPCDTLIPEPVGIKDTDNSRNTGILVYPNPSPGRFTINAGAMSIDNAQISIIDLSGREIHQLLMPKENQETYAFSVQLPPGIYILQWTQNGKLHAQKLVIQP